MELLSPVYLAFWLPIAAAVAYIALMACGLGIGHHDVDVSHDIGGHDIHTDVGHDAHVEHDVHHDHDAGQHAEHGVLTTILAVLGVGRVPISILMVSLCILWGTTGLLLLGVLKLPAVLAFAGAAAIAFGGTSALSRRLASLIPREESYFCLRDELIGMRAEVLYPVKADSGAVRLYDPCNNLQDLQARTCGEPIPTGTAVILTRYDKAGFFVVDPLQ